MKSEQLDKAVAVLQAAQQTYSEGMMHSTDSLVNEALKQLMDYQSLRLFDQRSFTAPLPEKNMYPKVLGN